MILKRIWLNFKVKKIEKNRNYVSAFDFKKSKNFALIYSLEESNDTELINNLVADLKTEGKEISILAYCRKKKKISTKHPVFDSSDISVFGNYNSENLKKFIDQNFDVAISLVRKRHYLIDFLLAQIKSKCRIGISKNGSRNQFEMVLILDEAINSKEIIKYLKMIQNNER